MRNVFNERQLFGRFYYRFPNGEAGTDVFDRTSDFISAVFRAMDGKDPDPVMAGREVDPGPADNFVLVTHGLLMRIFCMCYLRWTVTQFEQAWKG